MTSRSSGVHELAAFGLSSPLLAGVKRISLRPAAVYFRDRFTTSMSSSAASVCSEVGLPCGWMA
jgi:hypothetical protein